MTGDRVIEGLNVCKYFGGVRALNNVNFSIEEGEIVGLIGPNGSGKTTLFNVITGVLKPTKGEIKYKGEKISGLAPHKISKMGIARTYQIVRCFSGLSVLDNVAVGALYGKNKKMGVNEAKKKAKEILIDKLNFSEDKLNFLAEDLNLVEKKLIELGRAMAQSPDLLLIDELLAGLNPKEKEDVVDILKRLNKEDGITLFVIEHDIKSIVNLSDRIIVLNFGEKIAEGTPEAIVKDPAVIEAYLGESNASG